MTKDPDGKTGQMLIAFDALFEDCDTIVMTAPGTVLINHEPMPGFICFAGNHGAAKFHVWTFSLQDSNIDLARGFAIASQQMQEWMVGRSVVTYLGVEQDAAIDMVRVIFPGDMAEHMHDLLDVGKKLN